MPAFIRSKHSGTADRLEDEFVNAVKGEPVRRVGPVSAIYEQMDGEGPVCISADLVDFTVQKLYGVQYVLADRDSCLSRSSGEGGLQTVSCRSDLLFADSLEAVP